MGIPGVGTLAVVAVLVASTLSFAAASSSLPASAQIGLRRRTPLTPGTVVHPKSTAKARYKQDTSAAGPQKKVKTQSAKRKSQSRVCGSTALCYPLWFLGLICGAQHILFMGLGDLDRPRPLGVLHYPGA